MMLDRKTLAAAAVAFAVGYWWACSPDLPKPYEPQPDRPVLRFLAKAAKTLLWVAAFAEKAPPESQQDRHYVVQARVGEDGYPMVDHGKGW
jgi:hypothetical protein